MGRGDLLDYHITCRRCDFLVALPQKAPCLGSGRIDANSLIRAAKRFTANETLILRDPDHPAAAAASHPHLKDCTEALAGRDDHPGAVMA